MTVRRQLSLATVLLLSSSLCVLGDGSNERLRPRIGNNNKIHKNNQFDNNNNNNNEKDRNADHNSKNDHDEAHQGIDVQQDQRSLIIGGNAASKNEYPYFAYFDPPQCGGTLIASNLVLTAGHVSAF